jgi:hypothetical protein
MARSCRYNQRIVEYHLPIVAHELNHLKVSMTNGRQQKSCKPMTHRHLAHIQQKPDYIAIPEVIHAEVCENHAALNLDDMGTVQHNCTQHLKVRTSIVKQVFTHLNATLQAIDNC